MTQHIHEGAARYQPGHHGNNSPVPSATQALENPQQLLTEHIDLWTSAVRHKSTAGRGSNRKLELAGINKLRELILELAVRGKLVPQNPDDEPASELLKRIEAEKAKLMKDGKLKKQKPLPAVSDDEKPFELPEGWEWVRLGAIGEWGAGATPARGKSDYYGGHIPWFKSGELNADFISTSEESVTELALNECSLRYNNIGDVLIAMYGATIGKTSILQVRATTNQAVCACTPFSCMNNLYLLTLLKAWRKNFVGMGAGGAQPNISREKIIATVIALPPLAEQQRIVAKVDELMALCDQLEQQSEHQLDAHQQLTETLLSALLNPAAGALTNATSAQELNDNWQRLAQHFDLLFSGPMGVWAIDRLKDTILQLAVMGKLVPQNPNDEPASELLKRIDAEKARLVKDGLKTSASTHVSDKDKYLELPHSWEWMRLGNIAKFIDYRGKTPDKKDSGVRLITAKNIRFGFIDINPEEFISPDDYEAWMTRGFPRIGDMLFTTEAPLGNAALINLDEKFALAQRAICFQWHNPDIAKFMLLQVLALPFQTQLLDQATGMTATGIKASKLKEIPIILPPLAEQHRIVAKVDELFALCDQLKERLQHASDTQLNLTDAIVKQALS